MSNPQAYPHHVDSFPQGQKPLIILLLPAYNEELAIGPLLQRTQKALTGYSYQIVLVDDGSTDRTAQVALNEAKSMPIEVLRRSENGGLGVALLEGLSHIVTHHQGEELVVTMDADNTFDPDLIPLMVQKITEGADLVIASRYVEGESTVGIPLLRRFLSKVICFLLSFIFHGKNIRDYTCGYRCYRLELIRKLCKRYKPLLRARGFSATAEILIKALSENPVCREVPVTLRYDLKAGRSKLRLPQTILEYLHTIYHTRRDVVKR